MNRLQLINALKNYKTDYDAEARFIPQFQLLLQHADAYSRAHLPGHITGSAWIVDASRRNVLLTHHAKLNRWLQPGGHADGNENIFDVAFKEAEEETGLKQFTFLKKEIFDIDIHVIPQRKDFPQHDHYDVRILLQADIHEAISISAESHDVRWIKIEQMGALSGNNASMIRMAEKVRQLFAADQKQNKSGNR